MSEAPPHSPQVEEAVIGQMLVEPRRIGEIIGTMLEPRHFFTSAGQLLYATLYESFYADDPTDALSVGERCAKRLSKVWGCTEDEAIVKVTGLAQASRWQGDVSDHAQLIRRDSDYRDLLSVAASVQEQVRLGERTPGEIASLVSQDALGIATSTVKLQEIVSYGDAGREFIREMKRVMEAHAKGIELGAKFGLPFIDDYTYGLQPTELLIGAGAAGVGKSLVWGKAMQNFAERQYRLPAERRIGSLILSLEMGRWPSYIRLAQAVSGVPAREMRTGELDPRDLQRIVKEWGALRDIPLWLNFASNLRFSQLRALIVEAIRKHNVGLVMIDHMRMIDTDYYVKDANERDEQKVRFLKESLADDLNIAVICIAHSIKLSGRDDKRPQMGDLRGSGQIAAHADFVNFIYRPYEFATEKQRNENSVLPTDAEMLWRKNRHDASGVAEFYFQPETQTIM